MASGRIAAAAAGEAAGWGGVLLSAAVMTLLAVATCISYPAIIFFGDTAAYYPLGVGIALLGTTVVGVTVALTSPFKGSIAKAQIEPAVVMALMVQAVTAALLARGAPEQVLPTVLAAIALSSLAIGLVYLLLGGLRCGELIRYLPFPVVAGFLAGVGWLLVRGAFAATVAVAPGESLLVAALRPGQLWHWLPGLALGALLFWRQQVRSHFLNLPLALALGIGLFWLAAAASGTGIQELRAGGWLLGPFPEARLWVPLQHVLALDRIAWDLLLAQLPGFLTLVLVATLALLLNISGLEVVARQDIDFNRELCWHGIGNLLAGALGGMPGFTSLSSSALVCRFGAPLRPVGVITALACLLLLVAGPQLLGFVPKLVIAAVLLYLGLDFLNDWLVRTWRRMSAGDYAVLLLVFLITVLVDFVWAVGSGLAAGLAIFVVRYSRINVARSTGSGAQIHSHVERPEALRRKLALRGGEIFVLALQGFIFFGTASRLLAQIRGRLRAAGEPPLRWLVLDFRLLNGLDGSAAASFAKLRQDAEREGFTVLLAAAPESVLRIFRREGVLRHEDRVVRTFPDLDHALEAAEDRLLAEEGLLPAPAGLGGLPLAEMFADPAGRAGFLAALEREEHEAGGVLIRQGERSDSLLFIGDGRVEVRLGFPDGRSLRLRSFEAGTVVGEIAFYLGLPRSASVVAVAPTTAWRLTRERLAALAAAHPELAAELHAYMARLIAQRLNDTNQMLRALGE